MSDSTYRSGFIAVIGRPNVGKSTLLNALLEQKVAITSPKPQTTRRNQLGIYTTEHVQIIFVDTPGINEQQRSLDRWMYGNALQALQDADGILWLVDASVSPEPLDLKISGLLQKHAVNLPIVLGLNKVDLLPAAQQPARLAVYQALCPTAQMVWLSARRGVALPELLQLLTAVLPLGPQYYPPEQVTDQTVRQIAGELIREAVLLHLQDEIPHGTHVEIDRFDESRPNVHIMATIHVERDTHKGIVIGKGGQMLKAIGTQARKEIEALLDGQPVFLDLHVSVTRDWRSSDQTLRNLGFEPRGND
jgi:GTP-binding protein Era